MTQLKKNQIIIPVNLLVVLGSISVNIYLPSLPTLQQVFATSEKPLKLSITLFLLAYALSQFIWGSLSERVGRKGAVFWGLSLACVGSILAMASVDVLMLNIGRFIEGAGIGCAAVIGRAMLTDTFNRNEMSKMASFMLMAANIMPALAPLLGGLILVIFNWRIIFLFLILYTMMLIFLYYTIVPETHKSIKKEYSITHAVREYLHAFTYRSFLAYFLPNGLLAGGLMAYYATTPFIFITILHLSAHTYSFLSLTTVGAYILGAYLCAHITKKIGFDQTIFLGIFCSIFSGIVLIICWLFFSLTIWTVIFPMMIFSFSVSLITPNTNAGALSALGRIAGTAAAILGAGASAFGAILAYILNFSNLRSLSSLALFITLLSLSVLFIFYFTREKTQNSSNKKKADHQF